MPAMEGRRGKVADMLFELGAVKFGEFRLKLHETHPEAPPSPIYFELRTADHPKKPGPLSWDAMALIGTLLVDHVRQLQFECFTGLPAAGEPFADEFARQTCDWDPTLERLTLTKQEFPDGRRQIQKQVLGRHQPGQRVLVLDDLVTQADTKLEGIAALEGAGLEVALILVLVDRMQGGRKQLQLAGYELESIFSITDLLDHYVARGFISPDKAAEVIQYVFSNQA